MAIASGLECEVLEEADMQRKGMGSLLSVATGSAQPAKLVRVSYHGTDGEGYDLALVGKGITFDTGGISIKPAANMHAMKADMTGAASVIAAMQAIAVLKPKARIVAIAPCTENMPGGNATQPGRRRHRHERQAPSRSSTPTPKAASSLPMLSAGRTSSAPATSSMSPPSPAPSPRRLAISATPS